MTCGNFLYSKNGRRGIGVNQPQSGLHYPFVAPSIDVRYLLADFYLSYREGANSYTHPLKIVWIYGLGCIPTSRPAGVPQETHPADILITDANGLTVFNSTLAPNFSTWGWGSRHPDATAGAAYDYQIYQWLSDTAVCRLVAYNTWVAPEDVGADEDVAKNYPAHILPANAILDERCVYKTPKQTTSIRVRNGQSISSKLTGNLDFEYGYNTTFSTAARQRRGIRTTNGVTLNVEPGTGRGKYQECPESADVLYSINGLTGPDILISALDCLWTTLPTTTTTSIDGQTTLTPVKQPNKQNAPNILLASNCPACCGCDDYVQVGNYMNRTADRYRPIGDAVSFIVQEHTDNIARWERQKDCRLKRPLQIDATEQRCPLIDIVAQYCNQCDECATNVKLKIRVETFTLDEDGNTVPFDNTASLECGYTNITTPYEGTRLEQITTGTENGVQFFTANLGKIDIGNSGKVEFRLRFIKAKPTIIRLIMTATTSPDNTPDSDVAIRENCGKDELEPVVVATFLTSLLCKEDGTTNLPVCPQ